MANIKRFNENQNSEERYDSLSNFEKEYWNIIASDWAKHEDDYQYVYGTAEECAEISLKHMKKAFEAGKEYGHMIENGYYTPFETWLEKFKQGKKVHE